MDRYRNQRFVRGNKVSLHYNPSYIIDDGRFYSGVIDRGSYDEVRYEHRTPYISGIGEVFICNSFGGLTTDSGEVGTGYSREYQVFTDSGDRAYGSGFVSVYVPKDCFNGKFNDYMSGLDDKIYTFNNDAGEVRNCLVTEHRFGFKSGTYGDYSINYDTTPDDTIKILIPSDNYDEICQILMSPALAMVSCDDDVEATPQYPDGYSEIFPYGGGSMNPIVRQIVPITTSVSKKRFTNKYELEFKILG